MTTNQSTRIALGHRLAETASALNQIADEMRGMDRRGSYVDPTAAAERALRALDVKSGYQGGDLHEAIKELAHGLASLTRQVT